MICYDGSTIDKTQQMNGIENECGALFGYDMSDNEYNSEHIGIKTPYDGETYEGTVLHSSGGEKVQFLLIFTGIDDNENPVIFDYYMATMDAESTEYSYKYTYTDPSKLMIQQIEFEIPEITEEGISQILTTEGTQMYPLSITLLWNAEEDLDLTFTCDDGITLDWDNPKISNQCGAKIDIQESSNSFNAERGDGSKG